MEFPKSAIPLSFTCLAVCTWLICLIIAIASGTYIGGVPVPYFSDTGRDPPAYGFFATGFTLASFLLIATGWFNREWMLEKIAKRGDNVSEAVVKCPSNSANACFIFTCIGAPFLAMTGIFDTSKSPDVHQYSSYLAILMLLCFYITNTLAHRNLLKEGVLDSTSEVCTLSMKWKLATSGVASLAFLIYLPIGMALVCTWMRLSVAECLSLGYGTQYCTVDMVNPANSTETLLWDYSGCLGINTMRTISQHLFILSTFLYIASVSLDLRDSGVITLGASRVAAPAGGDAVPV